MNPTVIDDMSLVRYELERFLLGGAFELCEDDRRVATVEAECAAVEISYGKLVLSCWGDGWSRSWRVVRATISPQSLQLECAKQMGRLTCALELRRGAGESLSESSRGEFTTRLAAMIEANFAGLRVERAALRRDDRHNFTGMHSRFLLKEQGGRIAAVGVSPDESQHDVDATLGAGLVWLDWLRRRGHEVNRLMVFVPRGRGDTVAARLTAIEVKGASVSLGEVDETRSIIQNVMPFDQGDLGDRLRRAAHRAQWPPERPLSRDVVKLVEAIERLAPGLITAERRGAWVRLSIHGLEFARLSVPRKMVEFGVGAAKEKLTAGNQARLERLVAEIAAARRADSADRNAPLYREQAERWLEAMLQRDITALDASLDGRYAYSQVPAYRGEHRSFIDLLAATRDGRLVVIELKVTEDPEFPFQGLDYWLKIDWHRRRGDFARRGCFKQLPLSDRPPLLYLVAPAFRFHATTKLVGGCITARVPLTRIGINDDWRSGVRVLLFERLNRDE
jgi:BMFP domain-containing protein YqiC